MSSKILFLFTAFLLSQLNANVSNAAVPVSVLEFKNKVGDLHCGHDWYWWGEHLGTAFRDMTVTELGNDTNIELLERENINDINELEVNLINSEKSAHQIEKGNFKKAKYTIMGAVSSYEYCAEKNKKVVDVEAAGDLLGASGLFGLAAKAVGEISMFNANAKVVVDIRVVETQTGRIIKTIRSEGKAERHNFRLSSEIAGYQDAAETPVGEAARSAIEKAVKQIRPLFKTSNNDKVVVR